MTDAERQAFLAKRAQLRRKPAETKPAATATKPKLAVVPDGLSAGELVELQAVLKRLPGTEPVQRRVGTRLAQATAAETAVSEVQKRRRNRLAALNRAGAIMNDVARRLGESVVVVFNPDGTMSISRGAEDHNGSLVTTDVPFVTHRLGTAIIVAARKWGAATKSP